jgi:hypothetical protein
VASYHSRDPDIGNYGDQAWRPSNVPPGEPPVRLPPEPLANIERLSIESDLMGTERFRSAHPTYDGRGVTVAIIDGTPDLVSPNLQRALDLQGTARRKFADVVVLTGPAQDPAQQPRLGAVRESGKRMIRVLTENQ